LNINCYTYQHRFPS